MGNPNINYAAAGYELSLLLSNQGASDYTSIINQIDTDSKAEFNSSFTNAENASSSVLTYGQMIGTNMSLSNAASTMTNANTDAQNMASNQKDTYTRQAEINEWSAQNKLDTLFFLQILFIFLGLIIVLIFLRQAGVMSGVAINTTIVVLLIIVIGVLWNRASYTAKSRDTRYWNRRFLGLSDSNLSASAQCNP
jgi:hypothetical protein